MTKFNKNTKLWLFLLALLVAALLGVAWLFVPRGAAIPNNIALPGNDRLSTWHDRTVAKDELVVGLNYAVANPEARIREIAAQTHATIIGALAGASLYQLQYQGVTMDQLEAVRARLGATADVNFAAHHLLSEAGTTVPNDPRPGTWDELEPAGNNWGQEYVKAPTAWDTTTGSKNARIGVIDGGFDARHEDLKRNVLKKSDVAAEPNRSYHGNNTSGIACATGNNDIGITGMMWQCSLSMYGFTRRAVEDQHHPDSRRSAVDAAKLMLQAAHDGVRVVNMSLQWIDNSNCKKQITAQTALDAAEYNHMFAYVIDNIRRSGKDVLWVMAAGNECRDVKYSAPAGLVSAFPDNIITVAAIDQTGRLWRYPDGSSGSDYGADVTVAAPGTDIYTTDEVFCVTDDICSSSYANSTGTSMAAPFVTGTAGLVLSAHNTFTAKEIKNCIVKGATADVQGGNYGFKVLNAATAVKCAPPSMDACVFYTDVTNCSSTVPKIELKWHNAVDTAGCTFSSRVEWGDGTTNSYSLTGSSNIGFEAYATHTYAKTGKYHITITANTTAGYCSISGTSYDFTLN